MSADRQVAASRSAAPPARPGHAERESSAAAPAVVVRADGKRVHADAARRRRSRSTSTDSVDDALARSREGNMLARTWRERPRRARSTPTSTPRSPTPSGSIDRLVERVRGTIDERGRRRQRRPRERRRRRRSLPGRAALTRAKPAPRPAARRCSTSATTRPSGCARASSSRRSRPTSSPRSTRRSWSSTAANFTAHALQEPQAGQDLRRRRRRGRPRDARRALPHPEQGGEPRLDVPNSDWVAPAAAARSSPAARPRTRSRRAGWASSTAPGIHGTDAETARSAPPPRTAASACGSRT